MKQFLQYLIHPIHAVDYKLLLQRRGLFGAQWVFGLWCAGQPLVMFLTQNTAIARFGFEYGVLAHTLAVLALFSALVLVIDAVLAKMDMSYRTGVTGSRIGRSLAQHRVHLYWVCAIWALCLMTTVSAENGWGALLAYSSLFITQFLTGMGLSIRDGCVTNRAQKMAFLSRTKDCGVRDATV